MAMFLKRTLTLVLVICTLMALAVPAFAASGNSSTVSKLKVDTSGGNYYIVKSDNAPVRPKASFASFPDFFLDSGSLVKVTGTSDSYYKVDMNGSTRYIKKSDVKKAGSSFSAQIYYTVTKCPLRPTPFEGKTTTTLAKNSVVTGVSILTNNRGNVWVGALHNGQIHYVYVENLKKAKSVTLTVSGPSNSVDTRSTLQLNASVNPAALNKVTWSSNNTKVATVDQNGLVTGVYAGNAVITATLNGLTQASWNVTVTSNVKLDVKVYRQTTNYTCSAASALAVLRYYGKETSTKDTTLYKSINGYVGQLTTALNKRLNNSYKYQIFKNQSDYEKAIYNSLAQGSPVIARVKFQKGYFNYSSNGHYTTICGMYKDSSGKTWLILVDSFVDRYKSNSYANKDTGIVHVPLSEMYKYGTYGGKSSIYLIYNP